MRIRHLAATTIAALLLTVAASASADWSLLADPPNQKCQAMSFVDDKTGYVMQWTASYSFQLLSTTDGTTFTKVLTDTNFNTLGPALTTTMQFFDASRGIITNASGLGTNVHATSDGGKTWPKIGSYPLSLGTVGVSFATSLDGFAFGRNASFTYASTITHDGGKTWTTATLPAGADASTALLAMIGPDRILMTSTASSGLQAMYLSKDGGKTWTKVGAEAPPSAGYGAATFLDATHGYVLKNRGPGDGELFSTTDGGDTWTSVTGAVGKVINVQAERMEWSDLLHGTVFGRAFTSAGEPILTHTNDGGKTWALETVPAAIATDGAGIAAARWECSAYPGPTAYAGTIKHWLKNTTEGGAKSPPGDAGPPDGGGDASTSDAGTGDASTGDSSTAGDSSASGDSSVPSDSAADDATPPSGAAGSSGSSGGCAFGGTPHESIPGVVLAMLGVARMMRRRRTATRRPLAARP